jgi:prepilin peptidase CpaA
LGPSDRSYGLGDAGMWSVLTRLVSHNWPMTGSAGSDVLALSVPQVAALAVSAMACATDLKTRRIPNWLTLSAAAGAFGFFLAGQGWRGLGWSAAGWIVGLAMFFPVFLLRGIGGGDVKLVAALGAWLGPLSAVWLALYTAITGGPLALGVALSKGYTKQAFANVWGLLGYWRLAGVRPHPSLTLEAAGGQAPRLPYALPITAGLVLTLWLR